MLPPGVHGAAAIGPGDWIDCGQRVVTVEMIDRFADLTGDLFEIHMDAQAAARHGFAARVAHGLLVLSLVDGLKNQAAAQVKARASMGWDLRFTAPVLAGDQLNVRMVIAGVHPAKTTGQSVVTAEFEVTNQHGQVVLAGQNALLAYD